MLKYYREGELTNGRWAMAAVAGILFTDLVRPPCCLLLGLPLLVALPFLVALRCVGRGAAAGAGAGAAAHTRGALQSSRRPALPARLPRWPPAKPTPRTLTPPLPPPLAAPPPQVGLGNWWEAGANVQSSFDLKTLIIIEARCAVHDVLGLV